MWRSRLLLAAVAACAIPALAASPRGLGRAPTPEEIRGWDIDVRADGKGLPEGKGTVPEGERIFAAKCQSCHGPEGRNASLREVPELAGGKEDLERQRP